MKNVVVIPTYNERDNVQPLIERLFQLPVKLDLFFVDDASPDGTGDLLDELGRTDRRLRILHRPAKLGLGTAYRHVFHLLLKEPYERFITMDADLSHPPEAIPELLEAAGGADLVIGSRYVSHAEIRNCSWAVGC